MAPSRYPTPKAPVRDEPIAEGIPSKVHGLEGTYCTAQEIAGFSGTILELKGEKFRYWFYSDVAGGHEPEYPLAGAYLFQDGKLTLDHTQVSQSTWLADVVNGVPVLWRHDRPEAGEGRKVLRAGQGNHRSAR